MSDLIVAVVLLAATVTVLLPGRRSRGDPPERISPRDLRRLNDDTHRNDGDREGGWSP